MYAFKVNPRCLGCTQEHHLELKEHFAGDSFWFLTTEAFHVLTLSSMPWASISSVCAKFCKLKNPVKSSCNHNRHTIPIPGYSSHWSLISYTCLCISFFAGALLGERRLTRQQVSGNTGMQIYILCTYIWYSVLCEKRILPCHDKWLKSFLLDLLMLGCEGITLIFCVLYCHVLAGAELQIWVLLGQPWDMSRDSIPRV